MSLRVLAFCVVRLVLCGFVALYRCCCGALWCACNYLPCTVAVTMMRTRLGGGDQIECQGCHTLLPIYMQLHAADTNTAQADSCHRYKIFADLCNSCLGAWWSEAERCINVMHARECPQHARTGNFESSSSYKTRLCMIRGPERVFEVTASACQPLVSSMGLTNVNSSPCRKGQTT